MGSGRGLGDTVNSASIEHENTTEQHCLSVQMHGGRFAFGWSWPAMGDTGIPLDHNELHRFYAYSKDCSTHI